MKDIIKIFETIKNTNSINEKKNIIDTNKDNRLFVECLKFLLDDNVVTGISDKKIKKCVSADTKLSSLYLCANSSFEEVIEYLSDHNTGKDSDIYELQRFLLGHEDDREFYEQMITKTYRLGCNAKVVNKMIPGLISTFNVQLGSPIEKCKLNGDEQIYLTKKLNGTRAAFVGDRIMTRQGKEYTGLDHIINDLMSLGYSNIFIDGELVYKNEEGLSDSEAFQKGTGIANSKNECKTQLKLIVFDMFPLDEFWNGKSKNAYSERMKMLDEFSLHLNKFNTSNIEVVPRLYAGTDHSEIWRYLDYAEQNDWEGIIVNLDTPYECKRTKNLIKVKKFMSCDIKCTGVEEGAGRNKGTLGALICEYKGFPLKVGSGFTDSDRKRLWSNPEEVIGHIVSVKYKEETKNKDGGISIQFPVFETVRFDKNIESYN